MGIVLTTGSYVSIRLAAADFHARGATETSLRLATDEAPWNADYWARLGRILGARGDRKQATRCLAAAAALNPGDARLWMELAVDAESSGDAVAAEHNLQTACVNDATFRPRWELARFWFRQGDSDRFWTWARQAAERAHDDALQEIYRFCWVAAVALGPSDRIVFDRIVPRRPAEEARYLGFLVSEKRFEAAEPVMDDLILRARAAETPVLLNYCDAAIQAGAREAALRAWNALARRKLIPVSPIAPERGISLTDSGFSLALRDRGFGWRLSSDAGVHWSREGPGICMSFSGRQPETLEALAQVLPTLPSRSYRLETDYRTEGIPQNSGLRWRVADSASGNIISPTGSALSASTDWTRTAVTFHAGPECSLTRLSLICARELGAIRIEGSLCLRNTTLLLMRP